MNSEQDYETTNVRDRQIALHNNFTSVNSIVKDLTTDFFVRHTCRLPHVNTNKNSDTLIYDHR